MNFASIPIQSETLARRQGFPEVSVIVLGYNSAGWLPKCFGSLQQQTALDKIEVIFADNASTDRSVEIARDWLRHFSDATIVHNGGNVGFCEGNNRPVGLARGAYLLFLNPDAWLEPDCVERLLQATRQAGAAAASPWILNYADETHQDFGFLGFDLFGLPVSSPPPAGPAEVFVACGAACFIRADTFREVGMFDPEFFMYSDEVDLSWRVWIAGQKIIGVPDARVHHRGAATVNPAGGEHTVELRSSDRKRYFSNRNGLLAVFKNAGNLLLLTAGLQVLLLAAETAVGCLVLRRLSFGRATFLAALADCWRLRGHVRQERGRIAAFRRRSDFWMLRFFRLRLNRWDEIVRIRKYGLPRVDR